MQIISISETPNHNTMKITLSESREGMTSDTYTKVDDAHPQFINDILKIDGVKSIFHVMDF
ncbi:NifU N-terminal domain-containing protein, partial [Staphylococcus argenteus]